MSRKDDVYEAIHTLRNLIEGNLASDRVRSIMLTHLEELELWVPKAETA